MEGAAWYEYANVEWEFLALIILIDPHAPSDDWSGNVCKAYRVQPIESLT